MRRVPQGFRQNCPFRRRESLNEPVRPALSLLELSNFGLKPVVPLDGPQALEDQRF